jgi:hypothetical protein
VYVIACLFFLRNATGFMQVLIGLCLVGFCYGGYLAMMPSFTAGYNKVYFTLAVMSAIGIALVLIVKRPIHEVGSGGGEA